MPRSAEWLRFSFFTPSPNQPSTAPIDAWWRAITDSDPDQVTQNRAKGSTIARGPLDENTLILAVEESRIDVRLMAQITAESFSVGGWPTSATRLSERVLRLLELVSVNRLAFGSVVLDPVSDKNAGYLALQAALSDFGVTIPESASDFLLQTNLPLSSKVIPQLSINRLCKWSVGLIQRMRFEMKVEQKSLHDSQIKADDPLSFLRAELDFNTGADWRDSFGVEDSIALLRELVALGAVFVEERFPK